MFTFVSSDFVSGSAFAAAEALVPCLHYGNPICTLAKPLHEATHTDHQAETKIIPSSLRSQSWCAEHLSTHSRHHHLAPDETDLRETNETKAHSEVNEKKSVITTS
jgi:hypothetical protein